MIIVTVLLSFGLGAFTNYLVTETEPQKVTCQCLIGVIPMEQLPDDIDRDYDTSVR